MKKQFTYTLLDPISLAADGKDIKATKVVVKSPRPKDKLNAMALESIFTQSAIKASSLANRSPSNTNDSQNNAPKESKEDENQDEAAEGYMQLVLMGAEKKDISEMLFLFGELICEGNRETPQGTIDGQKFTKPLYDELSMADTKNLLGRYFYHFLSST